MSDQVPPPTEPPAGQPYAPAFPSYPTGGAQWHDRSQPPPSKTKAGWALGLAIAPAPLAWIVSLVLSIQVISDAKHRPGNGKGMAIAALIIIPVWILVVIGVIVAATLDDADRDRTGAVTHAGDVRTTDVRSGDCTADDLQEKKYTTIKVTPCDTPHYSEAYATFTLDDGDFPGQDEVDRLAEGGCIKRFARYVGVPVSDSTLQIFYLRPFESSWSADHGVTCFVTTGSQISETLKLSKR